MSCIVYEVVNRLTVNLEQRFDIAFEIQNESHFMIYRQHYNIDLYETLPLQITNINVSSNLVLHFFEEGLHYIASHTIMIAYLRR